MTKRIATVLCTVLMTSAFAFGGCSASLKVGEKKAKPAKPAPPPPPPPKEEPKPAPKPKLGNMKFQMKGDQLQLPGPVVFETGSDKLKPESDAVLNIVYDYLDQTPKVTLLRIEGHTDSDGDDFSNQSLSERRAMSVARWLVAKGIDCKRLLPVGFGESKPVASNDDAEGKSRNRRTAFVNAALDGKPIANLPVDGGGKSAGDACAK